MCNPTGHKLHDDDSTAPLQPWAAGESSELLRTRIFSVHQRAARSTMHPQRAGEFVYLDCPAWVNVIAITEAQQVILIEQYRHGLDALTLEIPGGAVDEDESPPEAALRELREETGCGGGEITIIGRVTANPAIQNNWVYTALVRGVRRLSEPNPDEMEEIRVHLATLPEVHAMIQKGTIHHAYVVAAFAHLYCHQAETIDLPSL